MKVIRRFRFSACYTSEKGKVYGHNFEVFVTVEGEVNPETGMVINLEHLKKAVNPVIEKLDHVCLNDLPYFKDRPPTIENIAEFIFHGINGLPPEVKLRSVRVETGEETGAIYDGESSLKSLKFRFSASHKLPEERVKSREVYGKCGEEKHGHNYLLKVAFKGDGSGIISEMKRVVDELNHMDLDAVNDLDFSTGEHILVYLKKKFEALGGVEIKWMHLEETENNFFEWGNLI